MMLLSHLLHGVGKVWLILMGDSTALEAVIARLFMCSTESMGSMHDVGSRGPYRISFHWTGGPMFGC